MTNQISANRVGPIQHYQPPPSVQQASISQGLAEVQSTIEQASAQIGIVQYLFNFLQRIYADLLSFVSALCCCCLRNNPNLPIFQDEIARELTRFDNSWVHGQIHGIYITSNETDLADTRQLLETHPRPDLTIHIGCATWHNLDIMCERRSTYGLIFDFNPKSTEFMRKTIELIRSCESREAFKAAIIAYLDSLRGVERNIFFHRDQTGLLTDRIERELSREGSWLESEENYRYIRELVSQEHLIAITEDIRNWESFARMRQFLDEKAIAIDTLYISNICNFMDTTDRRTSFVKSIRQLLNRDSILISCPIIRQRSDTTYIPIVLHQKAILGAEILAEAYDVSQLFEVFV